MYARIIADDVITLENIGDFLMDGPRGDRTRQMLADALRPAIDQAAGPVRGAVRIAVGSKRFDNIRDAVATEAVERTIQPFRDPEFSRRQADKINSLIAQTHQGAPAPRLRGDDARGDQGGRVDALRPRRDHGLRRWAAAPGAVRCRRSEVRPA